MMELVLISQGVENGVLCDRPLHSKEQPLWSFRLGPFHC